MAGKIPTPPGNFLSPKEILTYVRFGCEITERPALGKPNAGQCPQCGTSNGPGETACSECGATIPAPIPDDVGGPGTEIILHFGGPGHPRYWEREISRLVFQSLLLLGLLATDSGNEDTGEVHYRGDFSPSPVPTIDDAA